MSTVGVDKRKKVFDIKLPIKNVQERNTIIYYCTLYSFLILNKT